MYEVKLSVDGLENADEETQRHIVSQLHQLAWVLSVQTLAKIKQDANNKLHSSRRLYVENLRYNTTDEGAMVELLKPAHWIEDGRRPGSMVDDLLSGPKAKIGKDGTRYAVIPFRHNAPPTQMTESQRNLREVIKEVFKDTGRKWGQPSQFAERLHREGFAGAGERLSTNRIDKLDIMDAPIRIPEGAPWGANVEAAKKFGKGNPQGHGPIGQVIQGPTGIPYLQGIRVYENEVKTNTGDLITQKDVMTFRTVSEKHKEEGRWVHPGTEPRHFFEAAAQWAQNVWDTEIKPEIERQLRSE